jgi:uncharacterized protein
MTNQEVVQDMYQAFAQGDVARLLGHCAENAVWMVPGSGSIPTAGTFTGRQQIGGFFAKIASSMAFDKFEPRDFLARGDDVAVFGSYTARVPGTAMTESSDWAMRFTLRGGKVQKFQEFYDTGKMERMFERAMAAKA